MPCLEKTSREEGCLSIAVIGDIGQPAAIRVYVDIFCHGDGVSKMQALDMKETKSKWEETRRGTWGEKSVAKLLRDGIRAQRASSLP
jgi:hypothetical protein